MTEQETRDLETLKNECNKIRERAFNAMRSALKLSPKELKYSGFKTNEAAAIGNYEYAAGEIENLTKEFLKKYPDQKK